MTSEQETAMYDQPSGVPREELIEKAAKAIYVKRWGFEDGWDTVVSRKRYHKQARAAFAVFEEARAVDIEGLVDAVRAMPIEQIREEVKRRRDEAHTPAKCQEPGKTDISSAQMSVSGQIPTDDEWKMLIGLKLVSFSKRMEDGYPSTVIRDNEEAADLVLAAGFHRTPAPSDDEREAVRAALEQNLMDSVGACNCDEAYTGRDLIDPKCGWHDAEGTADAESVDRVIRALHRTVQGEPTDARLTDVLSRYFNPATVEAIRADLRGVDRTGAER